MSLLSFGKKYFRDQQETAVEFIETWEVRWKSRYGEYSGCTRNEVMVFLSKEDAKEFAKALKDAFELIKHTSGTNVTVKKNTHN